jgi:hypothetical protein
VGPIGRSRAIGWPQKLDCVAELSVPSPVVHLAAVLAILGLTVLVPGGARVPLAVGAVATLLPLGVPVARAFAAYPEKVAVLSAILRLPAYLAWRCWVLLRTIVGPREGWKRSDRHVEAGESGGEPAA